MLPTSFITGSPADRGARGASIPILSPDPIRSGLNQSLLSGPQRNIQGLIEFLR
jgi:hypothetical protein